MRGVHDIMICIIGNGQGNLISNPGQGCLHLQDANTIRKDMNLTILPTAIGKYG